MPRFVFSDFPLGNPIGRPFDEEMQRGIFSLALEVLERAFVPRTTVQTPYLWSEDQAWRGRYLDPALDRGERGAEAAGGA